MMAVAVLRNEREKGDVDQQTHICKKQQLQTIFLHIIVSVSKRRAFANLPNETNSTIVQRKVTQTSGRNEHVQTVLKKRLVDAVLLPIEQAISRDEK